MEQQSFLATRWIYLLGLALGLLQAVVFDFDGVSNNAIPTVLLSVVALGGFLWTLVRLSPARARRFGYVFGLGLFGWGLNWIYISMATFGGAPLWFAVCANALVVLCLSLYWLLGAHLIARLGTTVNQRLLLAPAVIVLLEWLRSVLFLGFPWLSLGYGVIDAKVAQYAAVFGVFGVSFILLLLVVLPLLQVSGRQRLALVGVVLAVGLLPRYLPTPQPAEGKSTTVALVQGNMPVIVDYNSDILSQNLVQYHLLTEKAVADRPDVVIWPESAQPFFYVEAKDFLGDIYAMQQQYGFDLIAGMPHVDWQGQQIYNSVLLQPQQPDVSKPPQFYSKAHLLPFGEYLPFRQLFSFFRYFVIIQMADFTAGPAVQPPMRAGGLAFSVSICYEAVFGNEIRQNARNADILLNVSNDAWFGRSKAQRQHLNIARMRAVENQKMLVRATNDGRTVVVSPQGRVLKALPSFVEGVLTARVQGYAAITPYARFGDSLILALAGLWLLLIVGCRVWRSNGQ